MKKLNLALSSSLIVLTPLATVLSCSQEETINYQTKTYSFNESHFTITSNEDTNIVNIELNALTVEETEEYKNRIAQITKEFVDAVSPNIEVSTSKMMNGGMHGGGSGMHPGGNTWRPGSGMGPGHGMSTIQRHVRDYMNKAMRATLEINAHLVAYANELLANETFKTQIETAQILQYDGVTIIDVTTLENVSNVKEVLDNPDFDIAPLINDPISGLTYNNTLRDRRVSMLRRVGMNDNTWMSNNCGWNDNQYMMHYTRPNSKYKIDSSAKFILVEIIGTQHNVTQELASSVAIVKSYLW